jgi:threonine/homoserine/homoserine lactone efflux protein
MWATPGPNNMMLIYSGANFGFKRTIPHVAGIVFGTCLLNMTAVMGLKPLIDTWPQLMLLLKITGSVWLVLIGWKMANASNTQADREASKPMRFMSAALFQFANPKAITATLALVSLILVAIEANDNLLWLIIAIIPPLSFAAIIPWVVAGKGIRRFLSTDLRWKIFTRGTGSLTAGCALFLWL